MFCFSERGLALVGVSRDATMSELIQQADATHVFAERVTGSSVGLMI